MVEWLDPDHPARQCEAPLSVLDSSAEMCCSRAARVLVARVRQVLSELIPIRDAKAYEQEILARTVGALEPSGSGNSPASAIALPAESRIAKTARWFGQSACLADLTNPRSCAYERFRGAGSELGELSEWPRGKSRSPFKASAAIAGPL